MFIFAIFLHSLEIYESTEPVDFYDFPFYSWRVVYVHITYDNKFVWPTGRWFSPATPVSSVNKTDRHDITEILLKVAFNTIKPTNQIS